jgi:hypothetical protein
VCRCKRAAGNSLLHHVYKSAAFGLGSVPWATVDYPLKTFA